MNRFESKEDYLETILRLSEDNELVRAIDIATFMNYSKPSVSIALKKLKELEYINVDAQSGKVTLTEKGKDIAIQVYERHQILTSFFVSIGVSEETAKEDACKIEHDISKETLSKIKDFLKDRN
jgi:Mn-dependent DtxR family transcriptional regulator